MSEGRLNRSIYINVELPGVVIEKRRKDFLSRLDKPTFAYSLVKIS